VARPPERSGSHWRPDAGEGRSLSSIRLVPAYQLATARNHCVRDRTGHSSTWTFSTAREGECGGMIGVRRVFADGLRRRFSTRAIHGRVIRHRDSGPGRHLLSQVLYGFGHSFADHTPARRTPGRPRLLRKHGVVYRSRKRVPGRDPFGHGRRRRSWRGGGTEARCDILTFRKRWSTLGRLRGCGSVRSLRSAVAGIAATPRDVQPSTQVHSVPPPTRRTDQPRFPARSRGALSIGRGPPPNRYSCRAGSPAVPYQKS
jgi:hypothetical protein